MKIMKTTSTYLKTFLLAFFSLFIASCSKENVDLCKTCKLKTADVIKSVTIFNNTFQFNRFETEKEDELLSFNIVFYNQLYDFISSNNFNLNGFEISKVNKNNLAGVVIFTNSNSEDISFSELDRMIFYVKGSNGFRTYLFKKDNDTLQFLSEFTFHTNYFASNDIHDFQNISSPNKKSNCYILLEENLISPQNTEKSNLQYFLENSRNTPSIFAERSGCYNPCDRDEGSCVVTGGGNDGNGDWTCSRAA